MKVILDAFGGDNSPLEIIRGAYDAVIKDNSIEVILCGDENKIKDILEKENLISDKLSIYDCKEVIENTDDPILAVKTKKESSIIKGLELLKDDGGDVFISAGNTGALFTAANLIIKRIKGVKRSAIGVLLPTERGIKFLFDSGANVTLSPEYYNQLAIMGSTYYSLVMNKKSPKVGLVNIGVEEKKGTENIIEAYKILKDNNKINFGGNCEARDVLIGDFDVVICDGFTGNIILKTIEGTAKELSGGIKKMFKKNIITKICALILSSGIKEFKKKFDYQEQGAAPIIGLRKPVMKAHGSSNRKAITSAILNSKSYVNSDTISKIESCIL